MMGCLQQLFKDTSEGTRISAYMSNNIEIFAQGSDLKLGSSSDNVHHLTLAICSAAPTVEVMYS
jgi:hypothetical protein